LTLVTAAALAVPASAYAADSDDSGAKRDGSPDRAERRASTVTLHGRGYGHGRGMSQWGAQRRATQGQSYKKILRFYYPHTRFGRVGGNIHVELTADTTNDVVVLDRGGLKVSALASGKTWTPQRDAKRWRITRGPNGRSVIGYRTDGWHTWRSVRGNAEFSAGGRPVTLVSSAGKVAYRGALRTAMVRGDGKPRRATVNVVSFQSYLKGVVPTEVPASWPAAAVRAQSVAARTYAANLRRERRAPICDTTSCQVYGGFSAEHPDSNAAVRATAGRVLLYRGKPAFTEFSASNGGWTAQGRANGKRVPYLPAKRDRADREYRSWDRRVSASAVERLRPAIGNLRKIVVKRDGHGIWNGRAVKVTLVGSSGRKAMSGEDFRAGLSLMSTWFERPRVR
jgi:SpoIID/LytB domain protein